MYSELIALVFGIAISVAFKVVPALDVWLQTKVKQDFRGLVMLGFSLLVPFGILGASCLGIQSTVACDVNVIPSLVWSWVLFVVANQGLFLMTGESKQTKARKASQG